MTEQFERNTKLNIHQRINAVMAEVDYIKKDTAIVDRAGKALYNVTGHDAVTRLVHPLFVKHGINLIPSGESMTQEGNRTRIEMVFAWVNIDKPDDFIPQKWFSYGIDYSDKGPGSACSYAQRYVTLKTLHIETGERDIEQHDIEFDDSKEKLPPEKPKPDQDPDETPPPTSAEKKVTKAQAGLIFHKFEDAGFNKLQMKEYLRVNYGVESNYSLPMFAVKEILDLADAGNLLTLEKQKALQDDIPF